MEGPDEKRSSNKGEQSARFMHTIHLFRASPRPAHAMFAPAATDIATRSVGLLPAQDPSFAFPEDLLALLEHVRV